MALRTLTILDSSLSFVASPCPSLILSETKKQNPPQPTNLLVETTTTTITTKPTTTNQNSNHRKPTLTATKIKTIQKPTTKANHTNNFSHPKHANLKGHPPNSNTNSIQVEERPGLNLFPQTIVHINRKYTTHTIHKPTPKNTTLLKPKPIINETPKQKTNPQRNTKSNPATKHNKYPSQSSTIEQRNQDSTQIVVATGKQLLRQTTSLRPSPTTVPPSVASSSEQLPIYQTPSMALHATLTTPLKSPSSSSVWLGGVVWRT